MISCNGEYRFSTARVSKVGHDLRRAVRDLVVILVHVRDYSPPVQEESSSDGSANALPRSGNDGSSHGHKRANSCLEERPEAIQWVPGMPETRPPIELQGVSLADLQRLIDERRLPPVDKWNPERCGHSGMRIASDGTWYHEGAPIRRDAMVRLFSTVLRREPDGRHVLVTPAEKLDIDVESTAFRALEMNREGDGRAQKIAFRLDSGDAVILGPDHPLTIVMTKGGLSPRLLVRFGLEAELTRPVYYELAELALANGAEGVWSSGAFFSLEPGS